MQVLVQHKGGKPYNISATIATHGFIQRGYAVIPFRVEEMETAPFDRGTVVVGGVGTYQRVFAKLGIAWASVSYPDALSVFLGRRMQTLLLKDLPPLLEERPLFIKPASDDKSFTGFVCKDRWDLRLAGIAEEARLIAAEVVPFQSEWRVYVLEGKIQTISRYRGQADLFPNARMIREMISSYANAPIAYSLDVGLDEAGRTLLVEVNEGLALGNYGLSPSLHAKMIAARWHEVMGDAVRAQEEAQTIDSPSHVNEA